MKLGLPLFAEYLVVSDKSAFLKLSRKLKLNSQPKTFAKFGRELTIRDSKGKTIALNPSSRSLFRSLTHFKRILQQILTQY